MDKSLIEKRLPVARWEIVDVTFNTADEDLAIAHTLRPNQPHLVRWEIIDANAPGTLYRGSKVATSQYVVLRTSVAGTYQLRLYIPARYEASTPAIAESTYTPPVGLTVADVLAVIFPVGSIYVNATNCTNPGDLFGFGTWVAQGAGRVPVGLDAAQTEFDTIGETGGAKTHALSIAELAAHGHVQDAHNHTQNSHNHTQDAHGHTYSVGDAAGSNADVSNTPNYTAATTHSVSSVTATNQAATATNNATTATNQNTGSGTAHNNLQPYVVECRWRRTA